MMDKNELEQRLAGEAKALETQVGFLNSLPNLKGQIPTPPPPATSSPEKVETQSSENLPEANPSPVNNIPVPLSRKLFFTGRLCAGKDYVASAIGAAVFGFADPMYFLAEYLFNIKANANEGKDLPGMRDFLQKVGQWGRHEVNAQYQYTPERAMFCMMVRSLGAQKIIQSAGVDWASYGLHKDFWIDGLLNRIDDVLNSTENRIAVTNCRFSNEYKKLIDAGFEHWHIVCSGATWNKRLDKKNLKPTSPELSDMSEKLATDLNIDLNKKLKANDSTSKMRVVWSDETIACPTPRLYTLEQFKQLAAMNESTII